MFANSRTGVCLLPSYRRYTAQNPIFVCVAQYKEQSRIGVKNLHSIPNISTERTVAMPSTIKLYTAKLSPPGRSVELTAKALGIELQIIPINLLAGDHLKEDFVKLNPQHTIPLLDDNGTIVRDSHAIIVYLVTKYGKDDTLYPFDVVVRSKVNAALHFDSGVLFARARFCMEPVLYYGSTEVPQEKIDNLYRAYQLLNDTLVDDYIVGNRMTLADLSCVASISSMHAVFPIDGAKYPKLTAWVERLTKLPYYKATNQEGVEELAQLYRTKLEENRAKAK